VVVVDGGASLAPRQQLAAGELQQRQLKADVIAKAWVLEGIDAVALAPSDWALGKSTIDGLVTNDKLPVLAANLDCGGTKPYPASVIVERANLRIGIVGVTGGEIPGCTVGDPVAAAKEALAALGPVDVSMVLLGLDTPQTTAFEASDAAFDFVIDDEGRQSATVPPIGKAWGLQPGTRGKQVGIATLEFVDGAAGFDPADRDQTLAVEVQRLQSRLDAANKRLGTGVTPEAETRLKAQVATYEKQLADAKTDLAAAQATTGAVHNSVKVVITPLGAEIADHEATAALVVAAKAQISGDPAPVVAAVAHLAPKGSTYAGADVCATCHPVESAQWASTPHARSWSALAKAGNAQDTACIGCHVTGVDTVGAAELATAAPGLRDVQCEACHGAAQSHASAPTAATATAVPDEATCRTCHDGKNDQGQFDWATYRPKVVHR
jgi:hypothetical protein